MYYRNKETLGYSNIKYEDGSYEKVTIYKIKNEENGLYGVMLDNKVIVNPKYDDIEVRYFGENTSLYDNLEEPIILGCIRNKYCIHSIHGKLFSDFNICNVEIFEPNLILLTNLNGEKSIIDNNFNIIIDYSKRDYKIIKDYDSTSIFEVNGDMICRLHYLDGYYYKVEGVIEYTDELGENNEYLIANSQGRIGLINDNRFVVKPSVDNKVKIIGDFIVVNTKDNSIIFYNKNSISVNTESFDLLLGKYLLVKINNKYGLIDEDLDFYIKAVYDSIEPVEDKLLNCRKCEKSIEIGVG